MAELTADFDAFPERAKVRLRLAVGGVALAQSHGLPAAYHANAAREVTALWLGPDQWLLLSDERSAEQLLAQCAHEFASVSHHAVDASAALSCARVQGTSAENLLSMGSAVDWTMQCVRTRFANIPVVAHRYARSEFHLYFDRSYRDYLEIWMDHALRDPLLKKAS